MDDQHKLADGDQGSVLGNTAQIKFAQVGRTVEGKVDTGATTSSLHATDITINKARGSVTFRSEALSSNIITLDLDGVQEVHSADAGGVSRPVVSLDVEVDGTPVHGAKFNLNDRSGMDSQVLIGQNILKAGGFTIDPSKDEPPQRVEQVLSNKPDIKEAEVIKALEVLAENNVTLSQIITYLQTIAVNKIQE